MKSSHLCSVLCAEGRAHRDIFVSDLRISPLRRILARLFRFKAIGPVGPF